MVWIVGTSPVPSLSGVQWTSWWTQGQSYPFISHHGIVINFYSNHYFSKFFASCTLSALCSLNSNSFFPIPNSCQLGSQHPNKLVENPGTGWHLGRIVAMNPKAVVHLPSLKRFYSESCGINVGKKKMQMWNFIIKSKQDKKSPAPGKHNRTIDFWAWKSSDVQ